MGGPPNSQAVSLPTNLPFRLVSKTIGSGAYASIKKATPFHAPSPVIAVKFINKDHAFRTGHLRPKQIQLEITHHASVCPHDNIIRFLSWGEDAAWIWLSLELADGGDLFDKIEADEGVGEDVAHFYFAQLSSAISWCHGKGVAHRDVKPENMLLSASGDLKLADFGLATRFLLPRTGERKSCGMVCGSPPYIAPEILAVGNANCKRKKDEEKSGYDPQVSDVWSCAIVLFVLLAGNTPWDSPVAEESYEYYDYVRTHGRPTDELWAKIPAEAMSLVRGMLKVEPRERFTMQDVRKHLWFTRANPHLNAKGKVANPVSLATQMLESLRIDFSAEIPVSQPSGEAMDVDSQLHHHQLASTQPESPLAELPGFDWEATRPSLARTTLLSASQPIHTTSITITTHLSSLLDTLSQDPSMSQFHPTPSVPLTLTQQARQFTDIVPSHSLTRFLSLLPPSQLLPMLTASLHRLNVPVAEPASLAAIEGTGSGSVRLRVKTRDARKQELQGEIVVERLGGEVLEVRFLKAKGDPVGWRRLFKQMAVLCKEGIVKPSAG